MFNSGFVLKNLWGYFDGNLRNKLQFKKNKNFFFCDDK